MNTENKSDIERREALEVLKQQIKMDFAQLIERAEIELKSWQRNCITCDHWSGSQCNLVNAVPPPKIIAYGCEKYEDDIPF